MMANQSKSESVSWRQNAKIQIAAVVFLAAAVCFSITYALAFAGGSLSSAQRWLLTIFLILFPTVGLGASIWLISHHYKKFSLAASEDDFSWTPMTPEQQRRKLNLELGRLAGAASNEANLPFVYLTVFDLALRQIEAENQITLLRHIALEGVPFDAVTVKDNRVYCVEVTFLLAPELPQERVDALLDKVEYAAKRVRQRIPNARFQLLLALVTKLSREAENQLRSSLAEKFAMTPVDVDIRFLSYDFLQTTFTAQ